eukprot:jgi/Botrbrau1/1299/Bobra.0063s0016.1
MEGKSRKRSNGTPRQSHLSCLPKELICIIFSYMDARTLCTVRIANKMFREMATERITVLRVDCQTLEGHPDANFQQFAQAEVQVYNSSVSTLPLLGAHYIRGLITSIKMADGLAPVLPADEDRIAVLSQLPKLAYFSTAAPVSRFPTLPAYLQSLSLGQVETTPDMTALSTLTGLTSLELSHRLRAVRPLNLIGRLTQLKHLSIECFAPMLSFIVPLSKLESLVWRRWTGVWEQYNEDAHINWRPVTRLQKLTCLRIEGTRPFNPSLHDLSALTGLECLGLRGILNPTGIAPAVVSRISLDLADWLLHLPRLTELAIPHFSSLEPLAGVVPAANLRALELFLGPTPGADVAGMLSACTALTRLAIQANPLFLPPECVDAIAGLTPLRSLSLWGRDATRPCPPLAPLSQTLARLTSLSMHSWGATDGDVAACTALTGLRELRLASERLLTGAAVQHLTKMTWLTGLKLEDTHIHPDMLTPAALAGCNQARGSLGWPALAVECRYSAT